MAVDTNINQFKQGKAVGDIDLNYFGGESIISVRYNPEATSTNRLIAGEAVMLKDLGADDVAGPPIDNCAYRMPTRIRPQPIWIRR